MLRSPISALVLVAGLCLAAGLPVPETSLQAAGPARVELSGRLALSDSGRGGAELRHAVVSFTSSGAHRPAAPPVKPPAEPFELVTAGKQFHPRVLAVPVGSTVRFPNQDRILHNVFSVSPQSAFDLGLYGRGKAGEVRFERPGAVRVFCNVHHSMVAYVLVMETPHYGSPREDGRFLLRDLPAGPGTLRIWHERTEPWSRELSLPLAEPLAIRLEVTRPRIPPHLNKFGKRYQRRRRGEY